MTASTPDVPSYRDPSPDEGHEGLRRPLADAIDDLAETVALLAQAQSGVEDGYFLTDLLFQMVGETMTELSGVVHRRQLLAVRSVQLPVLMAGSTDVTVTWSSDLGNASYQVEFANNTSLLGKVTYDVTATSSASCRITLRTTVAVPLGAVLELAAVRYS